MKRFLFITFSLLLAMLPFNCSFAQADISMTTHWNNRANYNPASIARTEYLYLFSNVRHQWTGISGAPTVLNVQASEYIHDLRSAFGISVINDKIGLTNVLNPTLTYAYRLSPNDDFDSWSLAMGISAGLFARTINRSQFDPTDTTDPTLIYSDLTTYKPDANFGLELQTKHFVLGLSTTHLFAIGKSSNLFQNTNHRYLYGIYKNTDSECFNFSLGTQLTNRNNLTVAEINTMIRFKHPTGLYDGPRELFDVGLSYRTSNQLSLLLGINITSNFRVGYSYDYDFKINSNQSGTHEIMLEYRIPTKASSICESCQGQHDWYY
jgi:type IX secretion system PorP/SprF family membrane protein